MGEDVRLLEEALIRATESLCTMGEQDANRTLSRLPNLMSPADCFYWSVERMGEIAEDAKRHLQESVTATALIEARGDRIDRLNADNRALLASLVGDHARAHR